VTPLEAVVARIANLPHPWRVGIDGVTAAGKTAFADALGKRVGGRRATIDDFHRPPPQEYYPDSFDFERFREAVLAIGEDLIVDGVFLHHPELRDLWDLTVFLEIDHEVARERGIARDASWMENAQERYATRYVPGEARYLEEVDPASYANVVIDMTDLAQPRLLRG
jgi:uridine kinase